jgi:hypothetical protein
MFVARDEFHDAAVVLYEVPRAKRSSARRQAKPAGTAAVATLAVAFIVWAFLSEYHAP